MKRHLAAALLALSLPSMTSAQQSSGQPNSGNTLKVSSRLVVMDVSVVDRAGNAVENLERGDFKVFEAGQPQTLSAFEAPAAHRMPAAMAAGSVNSMVDVQRLMPAAPITVIVLDELNTTFEDMAFARNAVRKYLNAQPELLTQPTAMLVATDSSFQQIVDYTLNRQQLLTALEHLKPVYPFQMMRTGNSGEGKAIRFAQTLASLQQIAQASSGHKGRKNIVWVGTGFPSIDLRDAPNHQVELVTGLAERTVNLLRDAHVTVYTINPAMASSGAGELDVIDDPLTDEVHTPKDPFNGTVSFNTLAPETGGRAFSLGNDVDREIAASVRDGNSFYTIAYVPTTSSSAAKEYRGIVVKVDRPGLIVRTRQGYYSSVPAPPPRSEKQDQRAKGFDLGTAVVSKMTFTGLTVFAAPSTSTAGEYTIQVNTNDIGWSISPDGGQSAKLILVAVALDAKDKPVGKVINEADAKLGPEKPLSSVPFVPLTIALPPAPGAVRIRFIVRDGASGQLGSADIALQQPAR